MKNILVPTDFSPYANNALNVAIKIAEKSGAEITLLHVMDYSAYLSSVYDIGVNESMLVDLFDKLRKDSEAKISTLLSGLSTSVKINSIVETGVPKEHILSTLKAGFFGLVVMGTKGTSGISEVFIGSNTERIVRESKVAVLSIGEETTFFSPKKIVFASDFEEKSGQYFEDLVTFAAIFDAEIKLVRINTPTNFENTIHAENLMKKFVSLHGLTNYTIEQFDYEQFEAGLNKYVKRVDADMVALGTHGRTGLGYFYFGGSKAEDVVNHFKVPVFTFRIH